MKYSEQIKKHYVAAGEMNYTILYKNSDSEPWKAEQETFKKAQEADKVAKEKYEGKFKNVHVGLVLLEDSKVRNI